MRSAYESKGFVGVVALLFVGVLHEFGDSKVYGLQIALNNSFTLRQTINESGFTSLMMIFRLCRYSRITIILAVKNYASKVLRIPMSLMTWKSSLPSKYSKKKKMSNSSLKHLVNDLLYELNYEGTFSIF